METYTKCAEKAAVTVLRIPSDTCLQSLKWKFWVAEHKIPPDRHRNSQVFVLKSRVFIKRVKTCSASSLTIGHQNKIHLLAKHNLYTPDKAI